MRELLGDIRDEVPNCVVGEAENGIVAINRLADDAPDVVLADIRMPKMDGIELARHPPRCRTRRPSSSRPPTTPTRCRPST